MMNVDHECLLEEGDLDLNMIESYPVEVLYTDRKSNISNVLCFKSRVEIAKFLAMRAYLVEKLGGGYEKIGKIGFWN